MKRSYVGREKPHRCREIVIFGRLSKLFFYIACRGGSDADIDERFFLFAKYRNRTTGILGFFIGRVPLRLFLKQAMDDEKNLVKRSGALESNPYAGDRIIAVLACILLCAEKAFLEDSTNPQRNMFVPLPNPKPGFFISHPQFSDISHARFPCVRCISPTRQQRHDGPQDYLITGLPRRRIYNFDIFSGGSYPKKRNSLLLPS